MTVLVHKASGWCGRGVEDACPVPVDLSLPAEVGVAGPAIYDPTQRNCGGRMRTRRAANRRSGSRRRALGHSKGVGSGNSWPSRRWRASSSVPASRSIRRARFSKSTVSRQPSSSSSRWRCRHTAAAAAIRSASACHCLTSTASRRRCAAVWRRRGRRQNTMPGPRRQRQTAVVVRRRSGRSWHSTYATPSSVMAGTGTASARGTYRLQPGRLRDHQTPLRVALHGLERSSRARIPDGGGSPS